MDKSVIVCVLACVLAGTTALVGEECTTDDVCGLGECCQRLSTHMVVSRGLVQDSRRILAKPTKGTCQRYQLAGERCGTLDKRNGYCSCEPGTTCHMYQVDSRIQQRKVAAPQPGYQWVSKCENHEK